MKPRILNAWSALGQNHNISTLSLESTKEPDSIRVQGPFPSASGDYLATVIIEGVGLTMAEDDVLVADGLIRTFSIRGRRQFVSVEISLEFVSQGVASITPGMPVTIEVTFSRKPVCDLMFKRRIAIDPGHGGRDHGFKGPVNLLEKDCTLMVAKELEALLWGARAEPLMTRHDDAYLPEKSRLDQTLGANPELAVQIHMSGEKDALGRSYHSRYKKGCPKSAVLALSIASALKERMGTTFQNPEEMNDDIPLNFPLVRIEPVCLTYFADEANFRAPLFRRRIAQGIFNGIVRYIKGSS